MEALNLKLGTFVIISDSNIHLTLSTAATTNYTLQAASREYEVCCELLSLEALTQHSQKSLKSAAQIQQYLKHRSIDHDSQT